MQPPGTSPVGLTKPTRRERSTTPGPLPTAGGATECAFTKIHLDDEATREWRDRQPCALSAARSPRSVRIRFVLLSAKFLISDPIQRPTRHLRAPKKPRAAQETCTPPRTPLPLHRSPRRTPSARPSTRVLDATEHALLTQLRAFDDLAGWHRQGALTFAHWLSWRVGLALPAAREKIRVARALADLPLIDDALRTGSVSYSKVRAMTRVATPANESELLTMAQHSTAAQLERICRLLRGVQADASAERAAEDRRWVRSRTTDDGRVRIEALLPADEAELVLKAIDASAETRDRADGLVAMAEATVRGDASHKAPIEVMLHVDAATLRGHFEDGGGVSAEASKRLCCDAGIVPVVDDADGNPLDVGRKTRVIPPAMKRALTARDGGCQFPTCTHRRFVDAHHIEHWAHGGETNLDNLVLLCRTHHRYVHEYGYSIARSEDGVVVRDPAGEVVPTTWVLPARHFDGAQRLRASLRARALGITANTNAPRWDGRAPDYDLAVAELARLGADPS